MSIFSLEHTSKMLDLCNSYTQENLLQNFLYPYYNWINNYIKCNWIYSTITYNETYYVQICISDKGSVICIIINNINGNYYPYGNVNFFDFLPDDSMTKYILQNFFVSSKYENINNLYILTKEDKIITIIHYPPLIIHIDKKYLIHISKLLVDYLDNKNYTKDLNEQHNIFKNRMTETHIKLMNKLKEKNDYIKSISKNNI